MLFSPARLEAALADGLSLGLRQFDRQFPEWEPVVDDIATVAQADVFTKLFVTGGKESVTDWHRDQSDVVATMLSGRKRFEVAPVQARDGEPPETEVGADLEPGVALLLPRSRLHCATPLGETSVLLSIGIMRQADWGFRSVAPTHLGLDSPPRSASLAELDREVEGIVLDQLQLIDIAGATEVVADVLQRPQPLSGVAEDGAADRRPHRHPRLGLGLAHGRQRIGDRSEHELGLLGELVDLLADLLALRPARQADPTLLPPG